MSWINSRDNGSLGLSGLDKLRLAPSRVPFTRGCSAGKLLYPPNLCTQAILYTTPTRVEKPRSFDFAELHSSVRKRAICTGSAGITVTPVLDKAHANH